MAEGGEVGGNDEGIVLNVKPHFECMVMDGGAADDGLLQ